MVGMTGHYMQFNWPAGPDCVESNAILLSRTLRYLVKLDDRFNYTRCSPGEEILKFTGSKQACEQMIGKGLAYSKRGYFAAVSSHLTIFNSAQPPELTSILFNCMSIGVLQNNLCIHLPEEFAIGEYRSFGFFLKMMEDLVGIWHPLEGRFTCDAISDHLYATRPCPDTGWITYINGDPSRLPRFPGIRVQSSAHGGFYLHTGTRMPKQVSKKRLSIFLEIEKTLLKEYGGSKPIVDHKLKGKWVKRE